MPDQIVHFEIPPTTREEPRVLGGLFGWQFESTGRLSTT
jgi:hypothetical protein